MTNLDLILKRFFAKYGRDYENLSILKDSMLAAYAIAMEGGYDGTFAEWLDFIFAPGRVHGADIYIQTTKPINPKTGDLWYNVSSLFLPYR
jgi:hypothetical protein